MQRSSCLAVSFLLVLTTAACTAEQPRATYATYADAERDGAVRRGWIPPYVPRSATDIAEVHDLDVNSQRLRFRAPVEDLRVLGAGMRGVALSDLQGRETHAPALSGPWPTELAENARGPGRDSTELTLHYAAVGPGAQCVAVEWKTATAYAWSCTL